MLNEIRCQCGRELTIDRGGGRFECPLRRDFIGHDAKFVAARLDKRTDADLEKLGNRAMGFLVAKYGYPQLDKFVNWSARPEQIALEMAEFVYWLQSQPEATVTARPDEGDKSNIPSPATGAELLCMVCARYKPWGIFDETIGAAVCVECRDKARRPE